jgi:hypothetical protein
MEGTYNIGHGHDSSLLYLLILVFCSYRVLSRKFNHWSHLVSDDNPRGYNDKQMQRIANADTLPKKRLVEMKVMAKRQENERSMMEPIDDEYGMDCINAMIADINAQYATMMSIAGTVAVSDDDDDGDISEGY